MNATTGDNVCAWPAGTSLNANSLGVAVPMFDYAAKSAPVLDVSLVSKEGSNTFFVQVPYLSSVRVESPFIQNAQRDACRLLQGHLGAVDGSGGGAYVCLLLLTRSLRREELVQVRACGVG